MSLSFTTLKFSFDCTMGLWNPPNTLYPINIDFLQLKLHQLPGQKEMVISSSPGYSNGNFKTGLPNQLSRHQHSLHADISYGKEVGPWEVYFYSMCNYSY